MYFFWPHLTAGSTFDPANLPTSTITFKKDSVFGEVSKATNLVNQYPWMDGNDFGGNNAFDLEGQQGIHMDEHSIHVINKDTENQTFRFLISNDGGMHVSKIGDDPGSTDGDFAFVSYEYNTTQFYGADKKTGEDRYVGGMQDNGTVISPENQSPSASTHYSEAWGWRWF